MLLQNFDPFVGILLVLEKYYKPLLAGYLPRYTGSYESRAAAPGLIKPVQRPSLAPSQQFPLRRRPPLGKLADPDGRSANRKAASPRSSSAGHTWSRRTADFRS